MPAGKAWQFGMSIYTSVAWLDNYAERADVVERTNYVGSYFEHITATNESTSYYMFGGPRLRGDDGMAMRVAGAVYWLHGDHPSASSGYHLGSASLTTSITGTKVSELRYLPFGETRWAWGVTPTDRRYTGQRELAGVGLYDYNARMYWPAACPERSRRAGRFVSADTVVPDPHNPQQFNRYTYVVNNPLKHTDSSGHAIDGYYPSYSDYAGFAFLGVAVAGAGYLAANPYSAQRAANSVAALATDLIESVPLNSGPAVTIEPIATLSFPLGPAAQATLETYPVGAGLAPGDLRTTFPLATGQTLQLAGPMQANPNGSNGRPDHQQATKALINDLGAKWGPGYTIASNESINGVKNALTGQIINLDRRPDAAVYDVLGRLVEVGEAYRPVKTSTRPVSREMQKMKQYQQRSIPSTWRMV